MLQRPCRSRGFSLTELVVAMVIGAIIVAIAVPAYQDYTRSARRSDGISMLLEAANRQARFLADNDAYTATLTDLGYASDPATSPDGFYQLSATVNANGYVLTATPQGSQVSDTDCGTLTYSSQGIQGASGSGACWP